ncbi:MAG: hypothetical protein AUG08_06870 [Acidobacteria bacterium 13_1_20CM_2_55_15]|nr:MAG: hypothetical protein AUG08_06870 [Acidobacteria bacterium 13_1_20CM_2_55_15]
MNSPIRIVLVEDNPADVFLLEKALQSRNIVYQLIQYEDGEQAMRAISAEHAGRPDLILVDLNLPRREGYDVLGAVRRIPRLVGVPVGVLTSSDAVRDRHRAALIGVERYIHPDPRCSVSIPCHAQRAVEQYRSRSIQAGAIPHCVRRNQFSHGPNSVRGSGVSIGFNPSSLPAGRNRHPAGHAWLRLISISL